ncbi:MAG: hypothetical protein WCG66_11810 [bacterium]
MKLPHLAPIIFALLMASCVTVPTVKAPAGIVAQMGQHGVPPSTQKRIQSGRVLDFDDIMSLAKAGVSDKAIVAYLKSTKAPYKFTTAQLEQLSNAGAGPGLVNYLGQSVGYYEASKRNQIGGQKWDRHPYFSDPFFWGAPPFDYGFPGEWSDPGFVFGPW